MYLPDIRVQIHVLKLTSFILVSINSPEAYNINSVTIDVASVDTDADAL